ncbi:hypothetical protein [Methylorubrum populi]|uniref:Uncharacterized protein n=1 Tax=Methylorubrum populi TaxID=223967 RepID=A0A833J1H8_9HYPH|nr:hypothetical protein [Methylorubrum populi]KAB7782885.1 hypothetical protein F8B43_4179 [Methylorubrum populi]
MKTRLTMRAALALGLPSLARGIGRMRRASRNILDGAGHEAGRGNVLTATVLVALYLVAL